MKTRDKVYLLVECMRCQRIASAYFESACRYRDFAWDHLAEADFDLANDHYRYARELLFELLNEAANDNTSIPGTC